MSIRRCNNQCCLLAEKCMHPCDPIFPGTCGNDAIEGGNDCPDPTEHPQEAPVKTYELVPRQGIKCLKCGLTSHHPEDVKQIYCGKCDLFHEEKRDMKHDMRFRPRLRLTLNGADPVELLVRVFKKAGYITDQSISANLGVMANEFCGPEPLRAEDVVTVADLKKGDYRTSRGQRQEGIVFLCLDHGVQPFGSFLFPPTYQPAIQLDCGCTFFARESGQVVKLTGPGDMSILRGDVL